MLQAPKLGMLFVFCDALKRKLTLILFKKP